MTRIIAMTLFSILLQNTRVLAQITLEHTFDSTNVSSEFYCTDLGGNDFKYVFLDAQTNSFSLYNMDMTPYITNIVIPVTTDSIIHGYTVMYITKTLFDCDSTNVEYVYDFFYDVKHTFWVFRTDGTMLLEVDSANGPNCNGCFGGSFTVRPIINTSAGAKLILQKRDSNGVPQILIYALCGELPVNMYDFTEHDSYVRTFPNPTDKTINFDMALPNNFEEFQIVIFDANGKEQKRENISLTQNKYSLDVDGLSSGSYFYSLISKNKVYQSGKFVLTK